MTTTITKTLGEIKLFGVQHMNQFVLSYATGKEGDIMKFDIPLYKETQVGIEADLHLPIKITSVDGKVKAFSLETGYIDTELSEDGIATIMNEWFTKVSERIAAKEVATCTSEAELTKRIGDKIIELTKMTDSAKEKFLTQLANG